MAGDANRPFEVATQSMVMQAADSQVNVYESSPGSTRIVVFGGQVEVAPQANDWAALFTHAAVPALMMAGEFATVSDGEIKTGNIANAS